MKIPMSLIYFLREVMDYAKSRSEQNQDQDQGHTADDLTQVILKANGFPIGILNVDSLLNAITLSAGPETGEQENTEVECTASDAVQGALLLRAIAAYDMFVQDHESISGPLGASQGFGWVNRGIIAQIDPTRNDIRQRTFDTREGHNMTNITTPSLNDSLVDGSTDGDTEEEVADEDDTETGVENEDFDLDSEIDADSDSEDRDLADDAVAGVRSILFPSSDGVATDNYVSPMKKIGPERIQVSMSAQEPMGENADMQHKRVAIAMDVAEILGDDAEAEAYTAGDPLMARDASGFPTDSQFAAMSKADASAWWKSMPIHRKRAYLDRHPSSKYGVAYRKAIEAKRRKNGKTAGNKTETPIERKAKPKKSKRTSGPVQIHKAKPKKARSVLPQQFNNEQEKTLDSTQQNIETALEKPQTEKAEGLDIPKDTAHGLNTEAKKRGFFTPIVSAVKSRISKSTVGSMSRFVKGKASEEDKAKVAKGLTTIASALSVAALAAGVGLIAGPGAMAHAIHLYVNSDGHSFDSYENENENDAADDDSDADDEPQVDQSQNEDDLSDDELNALSSNSGDGGTGEDGSNTKTVNTESEDDGSVEKLTKSFVAWLVTRNAEMQKEDTTHKA